MVAALPEAGQTAKGKHDPTPDADRLVVKRVAEIAEHRATKVSHLEDAVGALSLRLTPEEVAFLEEPCLPHRVIGHQ